MSYSPVTPTVLESEVKLFLSTRQYYNNWYSMKNQYKHAIHLSRDHGYYEMYAVVEKCETDVLNKHCYELTMWVEDAEYRRVFEKQYVAMNFAQWIFDGICEGYLQTYTKKLVLSMESLV